MQQKTLTTEFLPTLVSIGIFLFFSLTLSAPSGYSVGAGILLALGLYYLTQKPWQQLSSEDRTLTYILLGVFLIALLVFFVHGNRSRTMDAASRYVLAIPILLLLLKVPARLTWLWAGLIVGAISAAGIALWQGYGLNEFRIGGFTHPIQFGDIAFMLGVMCLAGLFWARTQDRHAWRWRVALIAGALAGFYSLTASLTRGSWVALPPVLLLFSVAFLSKRNLKLAFAGGVALVVAAGVFLTVSPNNVITDGYNRASSDIHLYMQKHNADTSVGARLEMWRTAAESIAKRPIFGWSYKDYRAEQARLVAAKEVDKVVLEFDHPHNNFLDVWVYQGLIGLLALLTLYIVPFWYFCKRLHAPGITVRALAVSGASLLVSFFTFSMTQTVFKHNDGIMFFVVTLVVLWACMRREEQAAAATPL